MTATMPWKSLDDIPVNGVTNKIDEVRQALSGQADRLTEMSAQYTRDAGERASDIADEATAQTAKIVRGSWLSDLLKAAAGIGAAFAFSSRKTAQDLGDNAQSVAKDIRNLRITTEPKKTGPDFTPGITLLAGFGAGTALMYFLDPERGKARRDLLSDKLMTWTRQATEAATGTARDLRGQMMRKADESAEIPLWSSSAPGSVDGSTTDTWGEQSATSLQGATTD